MTSGLRRALVATSGFLRRGKFVDVSHTVLTAMEQLPELEFVVMTGESSDRLITHGDARIVPWAEIKRPASTAPPSALMSANDPFMVIYTSGTTGQPKGAVHTHGGFPLKIAHDSAIHFKYQEERCVLLACRYGLDRRVARPCFSPHAWGDARLL